MNVFKFGGSSLSTADSIQNVLDILNEHNCVRDISVIVVSAVESVTDKLSRAVQCAVVKDEYYCIIYNDIIKVHDKLISDLFGEHVSTELNDHVTYLNAGLKTALDSLLNQNVNVKKITDHILAFGELYTASIITNYLNFKGIKANFLDTRLVVKTDNTYGHAKVDLEETCKNILAYKKQNYSITVATGFIGSTRDGSTTTLGRGGSDYTATLMGVALNAASIVKWTDVNGIMSADPKMVEGACSIDVISFNELYNLSKLSSGVLVHHDAIYPLAVKSIPFVIRNTYNRSFRGTIIGKTSENHTPIISLVDDCIIIKLSDGAKLLMSELVGKGEFKLGFELTGRASRNSILKWFDYCNFIELLDKCDYDIVREKVTLITLTSDKINHTTDVEVLKSLLDSLNIEIIDFNLSDCVLSIAIESNDSALVINELHDNLYKHRVLVN